MRYLGTPGFSWRRLGVLIRQLPADSRVARHQHGEPDPFTASDRLLATAVNLLAAGNWQRGGGKGSKPKPLRLPEAPRAATGVTPEMEARMRALVEERRRRREEVADAERS